MYETNMKCIERRLSAGLERLGRDYELIESDIGDLHRFTVDNRVHEVRRFEIRGVGNLVCMTNPEPGFMQMDSFVLTPYYKNLPLFTSDYMYFGEKRGMLNEIYSLVAYEDELYRSYIEKFAENCRRYEYLPAMPLRPCWYDSIRPVVLARSTTPADDDAIFELFMANLETFIEMEKASPVLTGADKKAKWEKKLRVRPQARGGRRRIDGAVRKIPRRGQDQRVFLLCFLRPRQFPRGHLIWIS